MARHKRIDTVTADDVLRLRLYGKDEPKLDAHLGSALNWYSATKGDKEARQWLNEFLEAEGRKSDSKLLAQLPDEWLPVTAGWLCRLHMRGYALTDHNYITIDRLLQRAFEHCVQEGPQNGPSPTQPNVQAYIRDKAADLVGEIEGMVDDKVITPSWSLYDYLRIQEASPPVVRHIIDHLTPIADELAEAMDPQDPVLAEAYKSYSEEDIQTLAIIYVGMLEDAKKYVDTAAKVRKHTRRKKQQTPERALKRFKYAKGSEAFKVASIDPTKILKASELWTFHPKSLLLTVYRANDSDGLMVKGSNIININPKASVAKRIGRKTDERLRQVIDGGKVALHKLMDEINGQALRPTRVTKDTVLLRVA